MCRDGPLSSGYKSPCIAVASVHVAYIYMYVCIGYNPRERERERDNIYRDGPLSSGYKSPCIAVASGRVADVQSRRWNMYIIYTYIYIYHIICTPICIGTDLFPRVIKVLV